VLTGLSHAWVSRILVRLDTITCSTTSNSDGATTSSVTSMDELIAKHILDITSASTSIDTLRPVTVWLLPLLYKNDQAMQQIWIKCMDLVLELCRSSNNKNKMLHRIPMRQRLHQPPSVPLFLTFSRRNFHLVLKVLTRSWLCINHSFGTFSPTCCTGVPRSLSRG
jgi:hypothetical protein